MAKAWVRLQDSGTTAGSAATTTVSSATDTPYLSVTVLRIDVLQALPTSTLSHLSRYGIWR